MDKQTVLVTGGAGYIGSKLVEGLLEAKQNVMVLDNLTYGDAGLLPHYNNPDFSFIEGDIRDAQAIKKAVQGVTSVVHLAAVANDPSGELDPSYIRSVNYDVYPLLLEEAKKAGTQRFINASTFSVYGIQNDFNVDETFPLKPLKEYSICKAGAEEIVRSFSSQEFVTVNLRFATVCGWSPRQRFDLIVNTLTAHALVNKSIIVLGGEQKRPQIHILDLVQVILKMLAVPSDIIAGEVFNVGSENISIMEIANVIKSVLQDDIEIESGLARDDERSYHVNSDKLFNTLGMLPNHTIQDAVQEIASAYKNNLFSDPNDTIYHNVRRMKMLRME